MIDFIEFYSSAYGYVQTPAKPISPWDEDETYARLSALYELEVARKSRNYIEDSDSIDMLFRTTRWLTAAGRKGLLLSGNYGNGKTTMLFAMSRFLGLAAKYRSANDLYDQYAATGSLDLEICHVKILLLDDLGAEPPRLNYYGETHYPLTRLLLKRYELNLVTVISTNLDYLGISEIYGARIADRMKETFDLINFTHPSYRSRPA